MKSIEVWLGLIFTVVTITGIVSMIVLIKIYQLLGG